MFHLFLAPHWQVALVIPGLAALYLIVKHIRRRSILHLPGPTSDSWLLGNVPSFQRAENAGEADFEWSEKYGLAFRTKGCFGEDLLNLADPKALQYVLNRSGYKYPKTSEVRYRQQLTGGHGILWADGKPFLYFKHRKIMNPAFSSSALRGFLPLFFDISHKTVNAWKATLNQQGKDSSVIDVSSWMTRTTLDIIGAAAFDYNFGAIDGEGTELYNAYRNLFADVHYMISDFTIVFRRLTGFTPPWLSRYLHFLPKKDIRRLRNVMNLMFKTGRKLIAQEKEAHEAGKEGGRDVMSIFVKANSSEDPKRRLGEDEVLSQIMTLTIAGHETTSNTLGWILFELSKHPDVQEKLRDEIRATRAKANDREDKRLQISDLESMQYAKSVMKESLRFHPIVLQLFRRADHDDVIPLERPQRTVSGEMVTAIPVSKGQALTLSLCVYNRLKSIWGEDADQWRPERFLHPLPDDNNINLGVFGNKLASFSSGVRSCIGWRFSLLEMQAILIEMVENFEFSPPPGDIQIKRGYAAIVQPMVKGQESRGTQLPLTVTAVAPISY
ncbi:cytochrome P450 [Gautieria morchelliformis]|nr:cytochrome P450 [Gautieria morchelliformis]